MPLILAIDVVIPAKAGIAGEEALRVLCATPAFAGVTARDAAMINLEAGA